MVLPSFILRPPKYEDVVPYTDYLADPEVSIWLDDSAQRSLTTAHVETIILRDAWCLWSIECEGAFVGVTSLYEPDLTRGIARYSIVIGDRKRWGQGLGTAVIQRVVEHGFAALGLRRIDSDILEPDIGSLIIHERAGFVTDGRLRQDAWRRGKWVDRILLSILRDEWFSRKNEKS